MAGGIRAVVNGWYKGAVVNGWGYISWGNSMFELFSSYLQVPIAPSGYCSGAEEMQGHCLLLMVMTFSHFLF